MIEKVADKTVGKPFHKTNIHFTVKCNLTFESPRTAQALQSIIDKFSTSAIKG